MNIRILRIVAFALLALGAYVLATGEIGNGVVILAGGGLFLLFAQAAAGLLDRPSAESRVRDGLEPELRDRGWAADREEVAGDASTGEPDGVDAADEESADR